MLEVVIWRQQTMQQWFAAKYRRAVSCRQFSTKITSGLVDSTSEVIHDACTDAQYVDHQIKLSHERQNQERQTRTVNSLK